MFSEKTKNTIKIIFICVPLLIGLFLLVGAIYEMATIKIEDASSISYSDMEEGGEYYFDELVLVDTYQYYTKSYIGQSIDIEDILGNPLDDTWENPIRDENEDEIDLSEFNIAEKVDYLVYFIDKDGTRVYTTLRTEDYSEFAEKCRDYIKDDTLCVGDVVFSGCFHGYSNGEVNLSNLNNAYAVYNTELPGKLLNWRFYYDDIATMDDYVYEERVDKSFFFVCAAIFLVPSIVGMCLLIRKRKKINSCFGKFEVLPMSEDIESESYQSDAGCVL